MRWCHRQTNPLKAQLQVNGQIGPSSDRTAMYHRHNADLKKLNLEKAPWSNLLKHSYSTERWTAGPGTQTLLRGEWSPRIKLDPQGFLAPDRSPVNLLSRSARTG